MQAETTSESPATSITQRGQSPLASMLNPDVGAIRTRRAQAFVASIKREQTALIADLERQEEGLIAKLEDLADLSPSDTVSLQIGKDVDPKKWVIEVQETKEALEEIKFRLEIANKTLQEFTQQA